jgi:methionyl-tRNA formyltransferase
MRLIFAGTPDFAVPALQKLASRHEVALVLTQPDRPAGRGRKIIKSPVKETAETLEIPVYQPHTLKTEEAIQPLRECNADVMIVVAYGMILPSTVLELPRLGCLNIHASLLPRWRGAAPIQRAIIAGDKETGITIMHMDEGLDTGDMLLTCSTPIDDKETAQQLHDRLCQMGGEAIIAALDALEAGTLTPVIQDNQHATYAHKLQKTEAAIDWNRDTLTIYNTIRAFNPWPVAQSSLQGEICRIWEATIAHTSSTAPPGTIIGLSPRGMEVVTGDGVLNILRLQLPGKKAVTIQDFVNGKPDIVVGETVLM